MILIFTILFSFVTVTFCAHDTTCSENQKHFADVCFKPKADLSYDIDWFIKTQPKEGWFIPIGNDVNRLHNSEVLQGKLLTLQDNFDNTCFRIKLYANRDIFVANITGFQNLEGVWDCSPSKDSPGVFLCDAISNGLSKYHENFDYYPVYTDQKNFIIGITCYPNGQAGWNINSATPTLTEEEKKIIAQKVNELGFNYDDHVVFYNDDVCQK